MKILTLALFIVLAILFAGSRISHSTVVTAASHTSDNIFVFINGPPARLEPSRWWPGDAFTDPRESNIKLTLNLAPPVAVNDSYTVHGGLQLTPLENDSGNGHTTPARRQPQWSMR